LPQPALEIARVDRPQKGLDHLGKREPLAGGNGAAPNRAALTTFIAARMSSALWIAGER